MTATRYRIQLKATNKTVAFPPVCPHCLRPATLTVGIKSREKLVGFYFVFAEWKHWTIQVPFCREFVRRLRVVETVCAFALCALVGGTQTEFMQKPTSDRMRLRAWRRLFKRLWRPWHQRKVVAFSHLR